MDKPLSVMIKETKDSIVNVVINSGVPMSLMELIVADVYKEIKDTAQLQYHADIINYNRAKELPNSTDANITK